MKQRLKFAIIYISTLLTLNIATSSDLCEVCECSRDSAVIDCSDLDLTTFNASTAINSTTITSLKLSNNQLTEIPELLSFSSLTELDLSHNKINRVRSTDFRGLSNLEQLTLSMNDGFVLSDASLSQRAFQRLPKLKILRLKQMLPPSDGFDYTPLSPLNSSLEELFITGTPSFSSQFKSFTRLHTLSLGGSACNVSSLTSMALDSLSNLPLRLFSARNCKINEINSHFLKRYQRTLVKLDVSCNHVKDFLYEIASGCAYGELTTLLIDHINKKPIPGQTSCPWERITEREFAPLTTVPLRVLSVQANQLLAAYTNLNFTKRGSGLVYLDASQNDFNNTAFKFITSADGQKIDISTDLTSIKNIDLRGLQYLAYRSLTRILPCGETNDEYFDCNEDSDLFLQDEFDWEIIQDPNILDVPTLERMLAAFKDMPSSDLLRIALCQPQLQCIIRAFQSMPVAVRTLGSYYATDAAINETFYKIWNEIRYDNDIFSSFLNYFRTHRYLPSNLTTLSVGNNYYSDFPYEREGVYCKDIKLYANNFVKIDLSGATIGFVPCRRVSGLPYLTNITCTDCRITGWWPDLFESIPVKYLNVAGASALGARIRMDVNGSMFSRATELEILDISGMKDGVYYIGDSSIFINNRKLARLNLSNNKLKTWNVTISHNQNLKELDLRNNAIHTIQESFRKEFDEQPTDLRVFLNGNTVNCQDEDYVNWLLASPVVADRKRLRCIDTGVPIKNAFDKPVFASTTHSALSADGPLTTDIAIIVVGSCVILSLLIIFGIAFNNRYYLIYHLLQKFHHANKQTSYDGEMVPSTVVYASHSDSLTDSVVGLVQELSAHGVKLITRQIDIIPGHLVKTSIVRLLADSSKVIVFLSPEFLTDEMALFELDLIKRLGKDEIIVVTANMDASAISQMSRLPQNVVDLLVENRQLSFPGGVCSGMTGNFDAFILTLANMLKE